MGALFSVFTTTYSRPSPGYHRLKQALDEARPEHRFVFVGSPLPKFKHPLEQARTDHRQRLMTELDHLWSSFALFCDTYIVPALAAGNDVVIDGCDFDALFAFTHASPPELHDELSRTHHNFVTKVLGSRNIPTPTYFMIRTSPSREFNGLQMVQPHTLIGASEYPKYLADLEAFQDQYFAHPAQKKPVTIRADHLTDDSVVEDMLSHLLQEQAHLYEAA